MNATGTDPALSKPSHGAARGVPSDFLKNEYFFLLAGYLLACCLGYLYFILTGNGLRAIYGDSWVYTDLAKRIAFNHSLLHKDYVNSIIYPPLYPLLISVAYIFRDQTSIFEAIKILNILIYSSAFLPLYQLIKNYAGLTRWQSFFGAILLLMNWCSLGYVIFISSEAVYCPLLAWLAWFLADEKHLKSRLDLAVFVMIFAFIPLTRTAGYLVFPAFAATMIVRFMDIRNNPASRDSGALLRRTITALILSAIIMLLYHVYLKAMLPKNHGDVSGGYLAILADPRLTQALFSPAYWLGRTAFAVSWIVIGTGTVAVPLLAALVIRNRQIILKDILAAFFLFLLAGTFIMVPLFTPDLDICPINTIFDRYYNPLLFLFVVIFLKYTPLVEKKDMIIAGLITLTGVIIAPPLTAHASCFALSQTHLWAVYVLLYGGGGAAFAAMLFILHRYKRHSVNIFLSMLAISIPILHFLDYLGGHKLGPNTFSFSDPYGITREILAERASNPNIEFVVDLTWRRMRGSVEDCEHLEYLKILIALPLVPAYKDLNQYLSDPRTKGKRFMVLTDQNIPDAVKVVKGQDIALYIFNH